MTDKLDWVDLNRAAVARYIVSEFAELCYVGIVKALAECAQEQGAVPKNVTIAFSRKPDKTLQVHGRATYNGEVFDYAAVIPDHWDREWTGAVQ